MVIDARIAKDLTGEERRGQPRAPVEIEAHVRELGTTGNEARVLNVSATGFMAETSTVYEVGARVWLILPGRERASAIVRWTAAGKLGAQFAEPLSNEALLQIGS
ncbi:PilZ domain-containing protein [Sphingomonas sp. LHG3406-1]|uniref:PilZ domain-containing protein n=1 Tax=Sphingomonas sp. LHG3406-1 TaxID=2804617 RepID=UPI0026095DEB|nr:PilZ domain-containing protein [Sphingomonas sp. LHG3406-1]